MTQPEDGTYKFDVVSVTTLSITTAYGEAAARQAAASIEAYEPGCGIDANPMAPDVKFEVTCVAPRGKPYLVGADPEPDNGSDTSITDLPIPEPIDGEHRADLKEALDVALQALEGDDSDAEHDALRGLGEVVAQALGAGFNPHYPDEDLMAGYAGDENEGEPDTTTR